MPISGPVSSIAASNRRPGATAIIVIVILIAAAVSAWYAVSFLPFLADDALISFRYAERLLNGHGLTWTDGPPVEGYSNLSWIMLLALMGSCGVNLILASRILGIAGMIATLLVIGWFYPLRRRADVVSSATGLFSLALSGSIAVWAVGGLEQPLQLLLLIAGLVLSFCIVEEQKDKSRAAWWASLPLGLLAVTRPDGFLFTFTIALGLAVNLGINRDSLKIVGRLALLPVLLVVGQEIFRLTYYGVWLPNPAYVKISGSERHLVLGLAYLRDGFINSWPITIVTLASCSFLLSRWRSLSAATRERVVVIAISLVAWCGYVAFIGGDIFPGRRHFLPVTLLMALLLIESMSLVWSRLRRTGWRVLAVLVVLAALGAQGYAQWHDPENRRAIEERWEWDGQVVGLMLKDGFGVRQPLLACTAAGCLPYWSELPCVDMLGLNDRHIARSRPADFGEGRLAHELGDGRYVLDRKPDLVSFCGPSGSLSPCYRSGLEMVRQPEFLQQYTPAKFEGRYPYRFGSVFWLRRFSDRIGILLSDSLIRIPAYLINGHSGTVAYLDSTNHFVVTIAPNEPGVILELPVTAGTWTVTAPDMVPDSVPLQALIHTVRNDNEVSAGDLPLTFNLTAATALNLMIRSDHPVELHMLELRQTR